MNASILLAALSIAAVDAGVADASDTLETPVMTVSAIADADADADADAEGQAAPAAPLRGMTFGPFPPAWQIDVGPGVLAIPRFPGSDGLRVLPVPQLDIRYKNQFFASIQSGIGYNLLNTRRWRAGPILRPDFGRTRSDIAVFPGLNKINIAPEFGGFLTYQPSFFTSVQLEVRQAVGGHDGLVADLTLRKIALKGKWTLGYGGRVRFADATYLRAYHGVTPAQSITSGLQAYRPGASFTDVGVSGFASRRIGGNWSVNAFGSYARLIADAARSPISKSTFGSRNQITLGASISYRFRFD
ncbi:MipA/OmpV family protein [Sphingomonas sp. 28-62-11]|uniref:MipA/OmpV family protein n=1 Tax=Sphingomonas sp. 28-62-11 TaxID=1970432 RepID=UPI0035A8964F